MICYPPCATCTGLCSAVPANPDKPLQARRVAPRQRKTISPGYIIMNCLHYTTPEEQRMRKPPTHGKLWCTRCNKWVVKILQHNAVVEEIPEGLF